MSEYAPEVSARHSAVILGSDLLDLRVALASVVNSGALGGERQAQMRENAGARWQKGVLQRFVDLYLKERREMKKG